MSGVPRCERQPGPTFNFRAKGFLVALIALVTAGAMVLGHVAKTALAASFTKPAAPASNTLSPYDIHLNYKRINDLPVQELKDAF
jgi:hypothetical protein